MNLNDLDAFRRVDSQNMLGEIDRLPEHFETAWEMGESLPLPEWEGIQRVVVAGMGGSAIGGDLVAAYVERQCRVPVVIHRDYGLPAWARGPETLVIASSHSGNTEETLTAFESAIQNSCRLLAVTTGGELARRSQEVDAALWQFQHQGQPRAAVGYSFALLLAALKRLDLIPAPDDKVKDALEAMRAQRMVLTADVPDVHNPAKRMAGQLVNRWVSVFGAEYLAPVARRWKGQISEVAKAWGQFEQMPESNHNTLSGILHPQAQLSGLMAIFLRAPGLHPRNRKRIDLTKKTFMLEGIGTDFVDSRGETRLAQQWTLLQFGDYTAYYLAMVYGVDPTPVEIIEGFKQEMTMPD